MNHSMSAAVGPDGANGTGAMNTPPVKDQGAARVVFTVLRTFLLAVVISAVVAGGGYYLLCLYTANSPNIWPGIVVLGQDLGGLTVDEAVAKLDNFIADSSVDIYLYNKTGQPGGHDAEPDMSFTFADLDFHPDFRSVAQKAYDMNVTEPEFYTLGWRFLTGEGEKEYHPVFTLNQEKMEECAAKAEWDLSFPITETTFSREEAVLTITLSTDGRWVNPSDVVNEMDGILENAPNFSIDVPYVVLDRPIVTAQQIHDAVYLPVKNAYFDRASQSVMEGERGVDFNVPTVQEAMDAAGQGETIQLNVTREAPSISADQMRAVLFRDVLGSASTHVSGSAARVSNVKLAANSFNNYVLNAGEVFSYNGVVGQRTKAKGYKEAPAYVQGQTVNEVGGGVCQPSSTLYLASLRSNMQITERYAHRYVPAYIPAGMDATVSWGGPDYKFTNNTLYPVKIKTSYNSSNGYLTVTLYGTKTDDTHVEVVNEFLGTTPWKTIYRTDTSLPKGSSKVSVTPYTGYKYRTYRNLYDGNGNLIESKYEATSDYKVRDQVILRNP